MKKILFLTLIFVLSSFLIGCNSPSKEDFYGWWKQETQSPSGNKTIYLSESILKIGRDHKILNWEKKDGGFIISTSQGKALLKIDNKNFLALTPEGDFGCTVIFSRITEEEAKKIKEEEDAKWERLKKDPLGAILNKHPNKD